MTPLIETRRVQIPNQDLLIDGYLACPREDGFYAAIIVIQEIFGVNAHIRDVTERIAKEGYVAIAPAIFQRQAPGFEASYTAEGVEQGRHFKAGTRREELLSDLQATIDYLYQLPQVKKTGVGTMGFCFGGLVVYLGATLPEVTATASFYGAGIPHWCPGEEGSSLGYTGEITGTLYAFFGLEDASIPTQDIEQIEQALMAHGVSHRVFRYPGADHGFFCDQRASYHAETARAAWTEVLALYQRCLH